MSTGVGQLHQAVDVLLSDDLSRLSGPQVLELARRLEEGRRRLAAVDHLVLAEMESRRLAGDYARASTVDLLVSELRVSPAEAKARVLHARDLGPRTSLTGESLPALLPHCADASIDGTISASHVTVIGKAVDAVPPECDPVMVQLVEATLVAAARCEHPGHLAKTAVLLLDRINPDGVEPREHDAARKRSLTLSVGRDGLARLHGALTAEASAVWHTILDSLTAPVPAQDGEPDPRTPGQRAHDGLLEAGMRLLRAGDLPAAGGVPVTILVRTTAADLAAATTPIEPDPAHGPEAGDGIGITTRGTTLSLRTLLQAGDADIIPVLTGTHGDVLRLGRTQRLANKPIRFALTARDGGCCFPACDKPATVDRGPPHHRMAARRHHRHRQPLPALPLPPPPLRTARLASTDARRPPRMATPTLDRPRKTTPPQPGPPPTRNRLRAPHPARCVIGVLVSCGAGAARHLGSGRDGMREQRDDTDEQRTVRRAGRATAH